MYGISTGLDCLVNLTVTKRGGITGYHSGCFLSGFNVFEIAVMARVRYLYQGEFVMMQYAVAFFL